MKKLFRLLKKIKTLGKKSKEKWVDLKKNGNMIIGKDCDLSKTSITTFSTINDYVNIEIGDNCLLMCDIVLHSEKAKVKIGDRVFIGPNTTLFCYDQIEVGNDVMISWGCTLIDTNAHSLNSEERKNDVLDWKKGWQYKNWSMVESKMIKIHKKSWIGFNSIINKGVILEEGTVVGAGSVVTKSTESFSVIAGNPAKFIKKTI